MTLKTGFFTMARLIGRFGAITTGGTLVELRGTKQLGECYVLFRDKSEDYTTLNDINGIQIVLVD